MELFALFDGANVIGGPQSVNPGGWTEVIVDDVPPGTYTEWDFGGDKPRLKERALSSEEQVQIESAKARSLRNSLLQGSDWTDTYSAPGRLGEAVYQQWQDYRQGLRDVSDQPGFPLDITWPTPPSTS